MFQSSLMMFLDHSPAIEKSRFHLVAGDLCDANWSIWWYLAACLATAFMPLIAFALIRLAYELKARQATLVRLHRLVKYIHGSLPSSSAPSADVFRASSALCLQRSSQILGGRFDLLGPNSLEHTFSFLSFKELAGCARVSTAWRVKSEAPWLWRDLGRSSFKFHAFNRTEIKNGLDEIEQIDVSTCRPGSNQFDPLTTIVYCPCSG